MTPNTNCTGKLMAKDDPKKLQEHYKLMVKYAAENYNGYIKSGIVKGKSWLCGKDDQVCKICRDNEKAGIIPFDSQFPSGHLHPPAGPLCRCTLQPSASPF